jgi:hypothetical protein
MTRESAPRPTGRISIRVGEPSMFLGSSLPVDVRDSSLRLVTRTSGPASVELPVGLYEVSAVLGDGQRHIVYANVTEGVDTPIDLAPTRPPATAPGDGGSVGAGPDGAGEDGGVGAEPDTDDRPRVAGSPGNETWSGTSPGDDAWSGTSPGDGPSSGTSHGDDPLPYGVRSLGRRTYTTARAATPEEPVTTTGLPDLELVSVSGARVVTTGRTRIAIACDPSITEVPTAVVGIAGRRLRLSLPISPQTSTPSGDCVITVERTSAGFHAQAWISPERLVANALQNLLSTGYLLQAVDIANQGLELLLDKYADPAAAALGALVLLRAGRLVDHESWMMNLAHAFPWLPDGKVLLAQLRVAHGTAGPDDLRALIEASGQRLLYAETASLLVDLLRRWPTDTRGGGARVAHALERVASEAPYIDRGGICLAVWLQDGGR